MDLRTIKNRRHSLICGFERYSIEKSGEYCELTSDGSRSAATENSEEFFCDGKFVHIFRQFH
jgi:hypothetical protein